MDRKSGKHNKGKHTFGADNDSHTESGTQPLVSWKMNWKVIQVQYRLWPSCTMVNSLCLGHGTRLFGYGIRPHVIQHIC